MFFRKRNLAHSFHETTHFPITFKMAPATVVSFNSYKPPNQQSLTQVREDRTTKNRNMSYANFKKATLKTPSLILLSISFPSFLPQVLPKGYFEIKEAVCCA